MQLSELEKDFIGDLSQDSHELWELYSFIKLHNPNISESETCNIGFELLKNWIDRHWIKVFKSRENMTLLSDKEFLTLILKMGSEIQKTSNGTMILELTDQAIEDIPWLKLTKS